MVVRRYEFMYVLCIYSTAHAQMYILYLYIVHVCQKHSTAFYLSLSLWSVFTYTFIEFYQYEMVKLQRLCNLDVHEAKGIDWS